MSNILDTLKIIFSEVLLCPIDEIDINAPYVNMGIDSILAIQVAKLIQLKLQVSILSSDLYNFLSIKELETYILDKITSTTQNNETQNVIMETASNSHFTNISHNGTEKIAIVGISGRFPGANDIQEYWSNLLQQKCSISDSHRWDLETEKRYKGGFLSSIQDFDAKFFNISPKEATYMDPQQRLIMEAAWHAFEDAGIPLNKLSQSKCGVFVTSLPGDYKYRFHNNKEAYNNFSFLGNAASLLAGRISHFFNLKGPSLTLDSACSSALVGIDLAVNHLQQKLCDIALVGATSVFSTPELFELSEASGLLSKSGLCHTFDQKADGFVPAEGVGCVVLKRYSDALLDQQQIYAVIEASRVNHDGSTNGLMSPNSNSQKELILSLYKDACIDTNDIGYIEAHGTGTSIGDPIEIKGLTQAFSSLNNNYSSYIGSSKTNIGHCLVASGLAGIFKILFCFKQKLIPAHLNFCELNPQIDLGGFEINTITKDWPKNKNLAAISAFGFGGTNAHMVLSRPPNVTDLKSFPTRPLLFVFTAKTIESLKGLLKDYLSYLQFIEDCDLSTISFSLNTKITRFPNKFITVAETKEDLILNIKKYLDNYLDYDQMDHSFSESPFGYLYDALKNDANIDLNHLYELGYQKISLPKYHFCRELYWIDGDKSQHTKNSLSRISLDSPQIQFFQRKKDIINGIVRKISELLQYKESDISTDKSFVEYGIDSLLAMQILEIFTPVYGRLSAHIIFEKNNIEDLAEYLVNLKTGETLSESPKELIQSSAIPYYLENLKFVNYNRIFDKTESGELEWIVIEGSREPIILLPPLNMLVNAWVQQIRFLSAQSFKLFIPHYPGHGMSSFTPRSLEEYSIDIFKSFDSISNKASSCSLIGWSLGGCISLILSHYFPQKIKKMILVNTAPKFEEDLFSESAKLRSELLEKSDYLKVLFNDSSGSLIDYISARAPLDTLKHYYGELQKFDIADKLDSIFVQSKIISGLNDPVISLNEINLLKKLKNSEVLTFEKAGHFIPLTNSYHFNKIIAEFVL